jgi:predicted GTPase
MYGQSVGKVLYSGSAPYRIENFFKEMCKDLPNHCDSKQIKKIADHLNTLYNTKLAQEKEERDGKNKKKSKPSIKGGGAKGYELNNNAAMISDVMGAEDDYGDYGDEGAGFQRENEAAYDFM